MEMIVIFNAGRDAAKMGAERIAPDCVMYPNRDGFRFSPIKLDKICKAEWLRGYDRASKDR